ncbi:hypothetical protein SMMN14_06362 [Sphaerulina musiva]
MLFRSIIITLASVAGIVEAAKYKRCKCHDSNTGLQVDWATEAACNDYRDDIPARVRFSYYDNRACMPNELDYIDGDTINNELFTLKCYRYGDTYGQYCWFKA